MGLYHELVTGDIGLASDQYYKAIDLCETHQLDYISSVYHSMGVMFHSTDHYEKGRDYYKLALESAQKSKDSLLIKKCFINLGAVSSSLEDFELAERYMKASLEIPLEREMDYTTYSNLGYLYVKQKKFDQAIPILLKATDESLDKRDADLNLYFLLHAKTMAKDSSNMTHALARAKKAAESDQYGLRDRSLLLRNIADYLTFTGNYKDALTYRNKYVEVFEEIKEKQRDQVVLDLEAQYETQKKEEEIKAQKQKNNNLIFFTLAIALLLSAMITLLYFRNRNQRYKTQLLNEQSKNQALEIEALKKENQLTAMNAIIQGQEEERRRIARDLHDNIGSMMTAIKLKILTVKEKLTDKGNIQIGNQVDEMLSHTSEEIRRISHNMTPLAFGLSGLEGAMEDLFQELKRNELTVHGQLKGLEKIEDQEKGIMIYRIFQELIHNILKHSKASEVWIQTQTEEDEFVATLRDNGQGFDKEIWNNPQGLGLKSVQSRIALLEGEIRLEQQSGTSYYLRVPL